MPSRNSTTPESGGIARLDCFLCGHEYTYVGADAHPGVCPNCGQRGVSFAGSVTVESITQSSLAVVDGEGGTDSYADTDAETDTDTDSLSIIEAHLSDATDRRIVYTLEPLPEETCVYVVRLEDTRLTAGDPGWSDALLPDALATQLADAEDIEPPVVLDDGGRE